MYLWKQSTITWLPPSLSFISFPLNYFFSCQNFEFSNNRSTRRETCVVHIVYTGSLLTAQVHITNIFSSSSSSASPSSPSSSPSPAPSSSAFSPSAFSNGHQSIWYNLYIYRSPTLFLLSFPSSKFSLQPELCEWNLPYILRHTDPRLIQNTISNFVYFQAAQH